MSQFLPETPTGQGGSGPLVTTTTPEVAQADLGQMQKLLGAAGSRPDLIPTGFMAYILDYIQTSNLLIPIGQIFGFSQFTSQVASIAAEESTTSTGYAALTTAGPAFSGLPDGQYAIFLATQARTATGGNTAVMSVSINGASATDADSISNRNSNYVSVAGFTVATLNAGANSVVAKYRTDNALSAATFQSRRLMILKYANL